MYHIRIHFHRHIAHCSFPISLIPLFLIYPRGSPKPVVACAGASRKRKGFSNWRKRPAELQRPTSDDIFTSTMFTGACCSEKNVMSARLLRITLCGTCTRRIIDNFIVLVLCFVRNKLMSLNYWIDYEFFESIPRQDISILFRKIQYFSE